MGDAHQAALLKRGAFRQTGDHGHLDHFPEVEVRGCQTGEFRNSVGSSLPDFPVRQSHLQGQPSGVVFGSEIGDDQRSAALDERPDFVLPGFEGLQSLRDFCRQRRPCSSFIIFPFQVIDQLAFVPAGLHLSLALRHFSGLWRDEFHVRRPLRLRLRLHRVGHLLLALPRREIVDADDGRFRVGQLAQALRLSVLYPEFIKTLPNIVAAPPENLPLPRLELSRGVFEEPVHDAGGHGVHSVPVGHIQLTEHDPPAADIQFDQGRVEHIEAAADDGLEAADLRLLEVESRHGAVAAPQGELVLPKETPSPLMVEEPVLVSFAVVRVGLQDIARAAPIVEVLVAQTFHNRVVGRGDEGIPRVRVVVLEAEDLPRRLLEAQDVQAALSQLEQSVLHARIFRQTSSPNDQEVGPGNLLFQVVRGQFRGFHPLKRRFRLLENPRQFAITIDGQQTGFADIRCAWSREDLDVEAITRRAAFFLDGQLNPVARFAADHRGAELDRMHQDVARLDAEGLGEARDFVTGDRVDEAPLRLCFHRVESAVDHDDLLVDLFPGEERVVLPREIALQAADIGQEPRLAVPVGPVHRVGRQVRPVGDLCLVVDKVGDSVGPPGSHGALHHFGKQIERVRRIVQWVGDFLVHLRPDGSDQFRRLLFIRLIPEIAGRVLRDQALRSLDHGRHSGAVPVLPLPDEQTEAHVQLRANERRRALLGPVARPLLTGLNRRAVPEVLHVGPVIADDALLVIGNQEGGVDLMAEVHQLLVALVFRQFLLGLLHVAAHADGTAVSGAMVPVPELGVAHDAGMTA